MFVKPPFPEEQDGITMSPVGGRRGAVFRVLCIFHNALPCSPVVRLKEAMDQDVDFTSIVTFSDFFQFCYFKDFSKQLLISIRVDS